MSKKRDEKHYDQRIIDALNKFPKVLEDKRHNLLIYVQNDQARSNETRFEHIAKKIHELKPRDIESIPAGIRNYISFTKSKELKETYYYFIKRKGNDKGFIEVAVKLLEGETTKAYIKTVFITYKAKNL